MVPWGLTDICLFAFSPTTTVPSGMKATTEGNILPPNRLAVLAGDRDRAGPLVDAAAEFVVPRSIPRIFSGAEDIGFFDQFGVYKTSST